jgi:pimeloyl-ACP methyl ester carboxylesterase
MSPEDFKKTRASLFQKHGFEGQSRWLEDPRGRKTHALVRDAGGVPTVLVHGGLAEGSVWAKLTGHLPGSVVVLDRPGCGLSYPIDYRGVDYRQHASDWLKDVLDALKAPRVNLVGNSMGGYFSMAFALAHPDRVEHLILAGAPASLDQPLPLFLKLWGNPLLGRLVGGMKIKDVEQLRRQVFSGLVAEPDRIPDEVLAVALASSQLPGAALASRTMLQTVTNLRGFRKELMLREAMATLEVPTLFLWGDRDQFAPPSSGRALAARMKNASLEVLPDIGHLPQLEAPVHVATSLQRFLAEERVNVA